MLLSGKQAAYSALIHEALRIISRPADALLSRRERKMEEENSSVSQAGEFPVILVVGAPRSGTTLAYQTLARYLDVSCITNLTAMFPRSPVSATSLFGRLFRRSRADFRNYYGQTAGLDGPNDGFCIWNRWLGDDRYVPRTDLTAQEMAEMRRFFDHWCSSFRKPLLNKNNRNTSCLDLLARAIPNSFFVVIRRNPLMVAQSLINAREQVQGDKKVGWGLHAATQSESTDPLAYVDDVSRQVLQIEQELDGQLQSIGSERIIEITYEGLCESPLSVLRQISQSIPGVRLHENLASDELKPFQISAGKPLTEAEYDRLQMRFCEYRAANIMNPAKNF